MRACGPRMLFAGLVAAVLSLLFAPTSGALAPNDAADHIFHFKARRALTLDATRIAVYRRGAPAGVGVPATLRDTRVEVAPGPRLAAPGWTLLALPRRLQQRDRYEALVAELAEDASVDFASPVFVDRLGGPLLVTRDILVGVDRSQRPRRARRLLENAVDGRVIDEQWAGMPNAFRVRSRSRNGFEVLAQANALAQQAWVEFAEPDMVFTGRGGGFPNDPEFDFQWALHNTGQTGGTDDMDMDAPEAWDISTGDPSILILVIDTGVEQDHPDINQVDGTDVTNDPDSAGDGGPVNDCDNHGTAVAGCATAIIDNALGIAGASPDCRTASVRTFISTDRCDLSWVSQPSWTVDALAWGESIGARVTNNSNFYGFESAAIAQKYEDLRNAGIVHFASAGNDASPQVTYPASLPDVNAVGALNSDGERAPFSNFGPDLAFTAPGDEILTTDRTGLDGFGGEDFVFVEGTSFASPYAAAVAGLLLAVDPALSAFDVESIMQQTSVDLGAEGRDIVFGWGFVNANNALRAITTSPADLTGFEVTTGAVLGGGLDELRASDDAHLRTRSGFGQTFVDLHNMTMTVDAVTAVDSATSIDVAIEARIDEPSGSARASLRNWTTGEFDVIGAYPIDDADQIQTFEGLDASQYVDSSGGAIELRTRHVVFVPFFAFTFESFIDHIEITVE